jgi:hypothetical protein
MGKMPLNSVFGTTEQIRDLFREKEEGRENTAVV